MKKAGKRKTYFKPLFKVNASKSEDVEKQSQLMLENHQKLTNSETSTTKDGLRRNHAKPKKNQYVLVHSFLDERESSSSSRKKSGSSGHNRHSTGIIDTNSAANNNLGEYNTFDSSFNLSHNNGTELSFTNSTVHSIKRSASCKSSSSADMQDTETMVSSSAMSNNSTSNGITNLFKKSIKKATTSSSTHNNNNNTNSSVHTSKSMDCLAGPLQFDPFVTTTPGQFISELEEYSPSNSTTAASSLTRQSSSETLHSRPTGFRKFYTRSKNKTKSKYRAKLKTDEKVPQHVNEEDSISTFPITYSLPVPQKQQQQQQPPPPYLNLQSDIKYQKNINIKPTISAHSQPIFQLQSYDYFSNSNKSSRNRSASSSSSMLRQQQQFVPDDSFLHTPNATMISTPIETPLGTPYEHYEDIGTTPSRTPTTMDDESNLEVCSITTSSTKRFKTLKRSSSIMSLNSSLNTSLNMPVTTPITTTQGGTPIPASPALVTSISNPNSSRSAINIGNSVYSSITTPVAGNTRTRILSCSSNVSVGNNYHHVQKSISNPNIGAKAAQQQQQQLQQQLQQQQYSQQQGQQLQQHQHNISKSKSSTPQLQYQAQYGSLQQPQPHSQSQMAQYQFPASPPQPQFQYQSQYSNSSVHSQSPPISFPPHYRSSPTSMYPPSIHQQPVMRGSISAHGDIPTTSTIRNNSGSKVSLDNYMCYQQQQQQQGHPQQPPQQQQQQQHNNNNNSNYYYNNSAKLDSSQLIPPRLPITMKQTNSAPHSTMNTNTITSINMDNTTTAVGDPDNLPEMNNEESIVLENLIKQQEKQILRQQLHHNDPQVLQNVTNMQLQLPELHAYDNIHHHETTNLEENFDGLEGVVALERLEGMEGLDQLNAELDQLINITRLEALAKEIEEFGVPSATSNAVSESRITLPSQYYDPNSSGKF